MFRDVSRDKSALRASNTYQHVQRGLADRVCCVLQTEVEPYARKAARDVDDSLLPALREEREVGLRHDGGTDNVGLDGAHQGGR